MCDLPSVVTGQAEQSVFASSWKESGSGVSRGGRVDHEKEPGMHNRNVNKGCGPSRWPVVEGWRGGGGHVGFTLTSFMVVREEHRKRIFSLNCCIEMKSPSPPPHIFTSQV